MALLRTYILFCFNTPNALRCTASYSAHRQDLANHRH